MTAYNRLYRAIKKGLVKKGACQTCGEFPTTAAFRDYFLPLNVAWFCFKHHKQEVSKIKTTQPLLDLHPQVAERI